jgi:hypothetical protein
MRIPIGVQVTLPYDATLFPTGYDPSGAYVGRATGVTTAWYKLTDHNRQPIGITYNLIEQTDRMANGTLRKYIVAQKFVISADWQNLPSIDTNLVDYDPSLGDVPANAKAGAWIKAFYEINAFQPVWVKLIFAQENTQTNGVKISSPAIPQTSTYQDSANTAGANSIYNAYMTTFTYDILKRRVGSSTNAHSYPNISTGYDLVNLRIEFTEI